MLVLLTASMSFADIGFVYQPFSLFLSSSIRQLLQSKTFSRLELDIVNLAEHCSLAPQMNKIFAAERRERCKTHRNRDLDLSIWFLWQNYKLVMSFMKLWRSVEVESQVFREALVAVCPTCLLLQCHSATETFLRQPQ